MKFIAKRLQISRGGAFARLPRRPVGDVRHRYLCRRQESVNGWRRFRQRLPDGSRRAPEARHQSRGRRPAHQASRRRQLRLHGGQVGVISGDYGDRRGCEQGTNTDTGCHATTVHT